MEHQGFTKTGSSEVWWVDGQEDILNFVSLTPMEDGSLLMEGKAQVKLKGVLSDPGSYGHFGMFKHELKVLEVMECKPLTGGPTMEQAIEMSKGENP